MKVLLVDDDNDLLDMMTFALEREEIDVLRASDPLNAMHTLRESQPDLVVLDVNIGAWDGFELLREVREASDVPVIMVTGRTAEEDKVRGLELGADDYVTKPFSYRELIARIRAHARRHTKDAAAPGGEGPSRPAVFRSRRLVVGPIILDPAEHHATLDGLPLRLTPTEFRLLQYLMEHPSTVVPQRTLLKEVWGYDDPSGADLVRVAIYRLRRKLGDDATTPRLLHSIPGVGVMLRPPAG